MIYENVELTGSLDISGTTAGSPTVTTDGSYTVIKFISSGTYTA